MKIASNSRMALASWSAAATTPLLAGSAVPCRYPVNLAITKIGLSLLPLPAGEGRGEGELLFSASPHPTLQHAFTLIEVILAIGVAAIVLITVSTVFFAAIRLRDATQNAVDNAKPADFALATMKRDLECVVTPTNGTSKVLSGDFRVGDITSADNNEPVAIEMFTATGQVGDQQPWGDIQRVTYELRDPTVRNAAGKDLYRSITRNLLSPTTMPVEDPKHDNPMRRSQ